MAENSNAERPFEPSSHIFERADNEVSRISMIVVQRNERSKSRARFNKRGQRGTEGEQSDRSTTNGKEELAPLIHIITATLARVNAG